MRTGARVASHLVRTFFAVRATLLRLRLRLNASAQICSEICTEIDFRLARGVAASASAAANRKEVNLTARVIVIVVAEQTAAASTPTTPPRVITVIINAAKKIDATAAFFNTTKEIDSLLRLLHLLRLRRWVRGVEHSEALLLKLKARRDVAPLWHLLSSSSSSFSRPVVVILVGTK